MLKATTDLEANLPLQTLQPDQNSPLGCLREAIRQYRRQSPAHFELEIGVHQVSDPYDVQRGNRPLTMHLDVSFQGVSTEGHITVPVKCHLRRHRRRNKRAKWECLTVSHHDTVGGLEAFIAATFPAFDAPLESDTLWRWWLGNGKSFHWTRLPTELKERVIAHCLHHPTTHGVYTERLSRFVRRYKNSHEISRPGPLEIIDQLGDWYPLLYVSHQVRTIALRLCTTGGSTLLYSEGLCIVESSYGSFAECIDRLGQYYQMTSSTSTPASAADQALAKTYRCFPKIYPNLAQYATLRHGIKKVSIRMDFLSFMQFFKVTIGGFQRYHKPKGLTYEIFERLPSLNEIVVNLPVRPQWGWRNRPPAGGPPLWHHRFPCPRILHRVIYERIAEALAPYCLTVRGFIDEGEKQRFKLARSEAIQAQRFSKFELEEMYADDGGGIQLLEHERECSDELMKARRVEVKYPDASQDGFFPPLCLCGEPCIFAAVLMRRVEDC